jgi:zinc and cadmium transporter
MLPHATQLLEPRLAMVWVLVGFLLMFFIQRYLVVHQHVAPHGRSASEHACGESDEVHHHAHEDFQSGQQFELMASKSSWSGAALGLLLHSLLNGVALAATFEAQAKHVWAGGATFIAIFVHKPFDALTITTLMAAGGWSKRACHLINGLFSLAIPAGVAMFYLGFGKLAGQQTTVLGCSLGLSAGVFLCLAASDLLPEMHFHVHDRSALSIWLLAGVGLAYVMEFFAA